LSSLRDFVFRSAHAAVMKRRREWFERLTDEYIALWWVLADHRPTVPEAVARIEHLKRHGPSPEAFTFRESYPAPDRMASIPSSDQSRKTPRSNSQQRIGDQAETSLQLRHVGIIRSRLTMRSKAPRQGVEGAPDAWLEVDESLGEALDGVAAGDRIIVITWLHQARRDVLKVHPRDDERRPLAGVFATRSPDRPNPIGLHPVTVKRVVGTRLRIGPIEAVDGTPVIDIKPILRDDGG
jgi:tRNA-Thr(GGU) m(6)t(6)A37 methyltransferase TsaA